MMIPNRSAAPTLSSPDELIAKWIAGEIADPLAAKVDEMRSEAAYLRHVVQREAEAELLESVASEWEDLLTTLRRAVHTTAVDYEVGARMSVYTRGTISKKVSQGELAKGARGRVLLQSLPISPAKASTLHALLLLWGAAAGGRSSRSASINIESSSGGRKT